MVRLPATMWAARTTMLPVMWAVNSPLRPRKPMMSVDPAITLRTNGSGQTAGSAAADTASDHLSRVDDLAKALFIDISQSERGLLEGQALFVGLVCDCRGLVVADHR